MPNHALFKVHTLNALGMSKAQGIASSFNSLLDDLDQLCGLDGREMAIVCTKLEEACFYAKKAMANKPVNQVPK